MYFSSPTFQYTAAPQNIQESNFSLSFQFLCYHKEKPATEQLKFPNTITIFFVSDIVPCSLLRKKMFWWTKVSSVKHIFTYKLQQIPTTYDLDAEHF